MFKCRFKRFHEDLKRAENGCKSININMIWVAIFHRSGLSATQVARKLWADTTASIMIVLSEKRARLLRLQSLATRKMEGRYHWTYVTPLAHESRLLLGQD